MQENEWISLFGRTTEDPIVRAKLAREGVNEIPPIPKDSADVRVQLKTVGIMLVFRSEALFPEIDEDLGEGSGVLTQATFSLLEKSSRGLYSGNLPFGIERINPREQLRERFGEPSYKDETIDEWNYNGYLLNVEYKPKSNEIGLLTVIAQESK